MDTSVKPAKAGAKLAGNANHGTGDELLYRLK